MLDHCAPGWSRVEGPHMWRIIYRDRTFWSFPKGEHGKKNPEIELGHVKKMIRHLGIDLECAKLHLTILKR